MKPHRILAWACVLLGVLSAGRLGAESLAAPATAVFPNGSYPILWEGQEITVPGAIAPISFFSPVFGAERSVVNPVAPQVIGNRIVFTKAGEYYLTFNGTSFLKVLVLGANEPVSAAVTRLFDFWVANCVFAPDGDDEFYADQAGYLDRFFRSAGPMVNLCGPTHQTLARVISEIFALPWRRPTFPGTFRWEGDIYYLSHNPIEVYLPDLAQWQLFDVNYAFTVRSMSAEDLCAFIKANASPKDTGFPDANAFQTLPVHEAPRTYLANDPSWGSPQRISRIPVQYVWRDIFRFYYGGVAYWGGEAYFQMPHGTEFLPGMYVWASLQTDRELEAAARTWVESFGIPVTVVSPGTLDALLADGHRSEIFRGAWRAKIPAGVLSAVPYLTAEPQVVSRRPRR